MSISIIGGGSSGNGGGGNASTGDITFSGVQIIGAGEGSGDGYGFSTIEVVPDANLYANHQYLVVDPTAPNHIHIRAGGPQDGSNAEIILGGEHAHVRVVDNGHEVAVRASTGGPGTITFGLVACGNQIGSANYIPPGTTFTYNDVLFTVTDCFPDQDCGQGYQVVFDQPGYGNGQDPGPSALDGLTVSAVIPFDGKTWTFDRNGTLYLAEGGLRFADNSVQTTAPEYFTYSYQDGDYGGGRSVGQNSVTVYSNNNGGSNSATIFAASLSNQDQPSDDGFDARVVLSHLAMNSPNGWADTKTLVVSAYNGITFPDGTNQATAGVLSVNTAGSSSYGKVTNIVKISQADYDYLAADPVMNGLDFNTVYIIVG